MPPEPLSPAPQTPGWQYAVSSGILGWILDAFDFFVVIFLVDTLAANFHVDKRAIVWTISKKSRIPERGMSRTCLAMCLLRVMAEG